MRAARYGAQTNGGGAAEAGDVEAGAYQQQAPAPPQQQRGRGYPGGPHASTSYGQQPPAAAAPPYGAGAGGFAGARGLPAEAKRPLEGQYPGGAGGRRAPGARAAHIDERCQRRGRPVRLRNRRLPAA